MSVLIRGAEQGWIPDPLVRIGIRGLCAMRARETRALARQQGVLERFIEASRLAPIAVQTGSANAQHYEVPAAFFEQALGPYLKYSCGLWEEGAQSLADAERQMLDLSIDRAAVQDGMRVLDLGCGWGSLTLRLAERFPSARIHAVSNSASQRAFIEERARLRGLRNVEVMTADINELTLDRTFDRVLSIEMFEHMRNHGELFRRIAGWLAPRGKLFVHVFCHREVPYLYEVRDQTDWMARNFFSGGMMPSLGYLPACAAPLQLEQQWEVNGNNYARTCRAWLDRADGNAAALRGILAAAGAEGDGAVALQRWRMFFMACEELFRYRAGREWFVAHYRFGR